MQPASRADAGARRRGDGEEGESGDGILEMIAGIELAVHPTQYWAYVKGDTFIHLNAELNTRLHLPRHTIVSFRGWKWLDLVIVRTEDYAAVLCGISGAEIAGSESGYKTLCLAHQVLCSNGQDEMRRKLLEWLDVRPLSPRWQFSGTA